jgi:hypothetical protein
VREEGEKPIKTKKRVTLLIKRMTSKKLLNLLTPSLFFRAAHEEPWPAAQILALQAGLQREENRGGPGQRRGQDVSLDRNFSNSKAKTIFKTIGFEVRENKTKWRKQSSSIFFSCSFLL